MSVNNAIFLVDIYMSRLENDTKSYKMFRRSKILFYHILSIFFRNLALIHITERKHSKLITILKFITRIDNIFVVQSFFLS